MHGVIFASFRDYVSAAFGGETAAKIFRDEPPYRVSESYPDPRLLALVRRTAEERDVDAATIEHDFGVFASETTFARLYPALFAICGSARDFLLTVETRIHELVRATIPLAGPPALDVTELAEDGVQIVYTSPRQLCVLLRGLTEGAARHYGERIEIEETSCMRRGDSACTFAVRFAPAQIA